MKDHECDAEMNDNFDSTENQFKMKETAQISLFIILPMLFELPLN